MIKIIWNKSDDCFDKTSEQLKTGLKESGETSFSPFHFFTFFRRKKCHSEKRFLVFCSFRSEIRRKFCLSRKPLVGVSLWREEVYQDFPVHVVEGVDVHAEGLGHARHVQSERLKQCQKINVLTWKSESQMRTCDQQDDAKWVNTLLINLLQEWKGNN